MATDAERVLACGDAVAQRCDSSRDAGSGILTRVPLSRRNWAAHFGCDGQSRQTIDPEDRFDASLNASLFVANTAFYVLLNMPSYDIIARSGPGHSTR
jgi:hypothetical protein